MKGEVLNNKHQQRLDCYKRGMSDKAAALICGISATTYRDWRCSHRLVINLSRRDYKFNDAGRVVKKEEHYEDEGKEMPPSNTSPCKTMMVDKMVVEDYLKRYGNRVEPIKMPLSERAKTWNMRGIVIGSSYYTRRL